jgi:hypothetical protein
VVATADRALTAGRILQRRCRGSRLSNASGKGTIVRLQWAMDADEINIMSSGAVFRATVGRNIYEYSLAGSAAMLEAVGRCTGQLAAEANPFGSAPPVATSKIPLASTETPSNPFRRL